MKTSADALSRFATATTLLGLTVAFLSGGCSKPSSFYVSPVGDDAWSGQDPIATTDSDEGPFDTLERARDAIRELKRGGDLPPGGITVYMRGGVYVRDQLSS